MADVAQMDLTFYRLLEGGSKPQIEIETVERLGRPFRLEVWQMLAPLPVLRRTKFKRPKAKIAAPVVPGRSGMESWLRGKQRTLNVSSTRAGGWSAGGL